MTHRILLLVALLSFVGFNASSQTKERITYDDNGRISKVVFTQSNQMLTINYEYDNRGNITRTTNELVTSVDEQTTSIKIAVMPNPSTHEITIESPASDGETVGYVITATDGREVFRKEIRAGTTGLARLVLDATSNGLASGSYQVTATTAKGKTTAGFVVGK